MIVTAVPEMNPAAAPAFFFCEEIKRQGEEEDSRGKKEEAEDLSDTH